MGQGVTRCYMMSYQGHLFAGNRAEANRSSQLCRGTSTTIMLKKRGIGKKLQLTIRVVR